MKKRVLGIAALLLLFVLLGLSALLNVVLVVSAPFRVASTPDAARGFREYTLYPGSESSKIVHIDIEGLITNVGGGFLGSSTRNVKPMLEAAEADPLVKAIVLRINSPGGEITASDVLYHAVQRVAAVKPVVVYMDSVGASGGYYIACGGTHLMANETTLTGSIGVIIQTLNYEELMGKVGLDSVVFTSGEFKDMLSPSREMRPEEQAYVQGMVDEMYDRFVGIVAEAREIPVSELKNGVADGRVLTGAKALEHRLIDATGYIEEAYAKARELGGVSNARIVRYGPHLSWGNLMGFLGKTSADAEEVKRIRLEVGEGLFPKLQPGAVYLLPAHFAF